MAVTQSVLGWGRAGNRVLAGGDSAVSESWAGPAFPGKSYMEGGLGCEGL